MKVQCRHCNKRFSGDRSAVVGVKSCPKCAASGNWWNSMEPEELRQNDPEATPIVPNEPVEEAAPTLMPRPTVDEVPLYARAGHPTPNTGDFSQGSTGVEDDVVALRAKVRALGRTVDMMRNEQLANRRPATNKLVWSNDLVLLLIIAYLFFANAQRQTQINALEARIYAIEKWTEQDFLVRPPWAG